MKADALGGAVEGGDTRRPTVEGVEYRLVWKRVGLAVKRKRFARRSSVDKFLLLLGPEPWLYHGKGPDDEFTGGDDYTDGMTYREYDAKQRRDLPALEWVRVETRPVGLWTLAPSNVGRAPADAADRDPHGASGPKA